jgi:elongator complex protein 3
MGLIQQRWRKHTGVTRAVHRNVGLVIETRPDHVDLSELAWLPELGVTKSSNGRQSMDDSILALNQRGHTVAETRSAVGLLRAAGFKIVLHWMPNLLGASPDSDRQDFSRLWDGLCPDEIKIYPNQLLENTDLHAFWLRGEYRPYTTQELVELIADIKPTIPRYCRVNRVIRDIPSTYVVEGNKRTSLRQDVQEELRRRGEACRCVRCREVRGRKVDPGSLVLHDLVYQAADSQEHFLSFDTQEDHLAAFAPVLPGQARQRRIGRSGARRHHREVHVMVSLCRWEAMNSVPPSSGLGRRLIEEAEHCPSGGISAPGGDRRYRLYDHTTCAWYERGDRYLIKTLADLGQDDREMLDSASSSG